MEVGMQSLYIKNFKNIPELTIDRLARVNLIVGKNSVGKSTLLEALSIYFAKGNEDWLRELLENRGEIINFRVPSEERGIINARHYCSLFTGHKEDYSKDFCIVIGESKEDKDLVKINQVYISKDKELDEKGDVWVRRNALSYEEWVDSKDTWNVCGQGLMVTSGVKQTIIPYDKARTISQGDGNMKFQYVHTIDFNKDKNASLFDNISLSPEEVYIVQALQVINPRITRINFLNSDVVRMGGRQERVPVVTLEGDNNKYLLSSMGDGINRILTIILAMLNCKGGTLLLDEFETGLHYSVQDELWKIIFMLAEELGIQVFVTTHSNDCVNSFARTNTGEKGMVIRLEERKGNIKAVSYTDPEELMFATTNKIEIR